MALKDYMAVEDMTTEFFFGLLMALDITNVMRLALIGQDDEFIISVITVGIIGCNFAWGLADGVMNSISQYYENLKQYQFAQKLRGMPDGKDATDLTARALRDNMSPMQSDLVDEVALRTLSATVVTNARTAHLESPKFGKPEWMVLILSTGLNLIAAVPILFVYSIAIFIGLNAATAISNLVGLLMLFLIGYYLSRKAKSRKSLYAGLLMVGVGLIMLVVVVAMGG
ncbi:MAG: hypothetical protein WCK39_04765 [Methanomassiliicoccales archaeon]